MIGWCEIDGAGSQRVAGSSFAHLDARPVAVETANVDSIPRTPVDHDADDRREISSQQSAEFEQRLYAAGRSADDDDIPFGCDAHSWTLPPVSDCVGVLL